MKKQTYHFELSSSAALCGGYLCPSPFEMTEKQTLRFAERLARDYFRNNPKMQGRTHYSVNICTDADCFDMVLNVSVWKGSARSRAHVMVYDYRSEEVVADNLF